MVSRTSRARLPRLPRPGAYNRVVARTWILTGSPENDAATRVHNFAIIGSTELSAGLGART